MSDGPPVRAGGQGLAPSGIAADLDGVAGRMETALKSVGESAARRELEECLELLRRKAMGLRDLSPLLDAQRAEALARREEELKSIILATTEGLHAISRANRQMASKVGDQLQDIDEIVALPPSDELVKRLSNAARQVRDAAGELEKNLDTTGASLAKSNERITALEAELQEARRKALYDGLTRLYRRMVLDERLQAAVAGAESNGPWCFLMADIDRFKNVNDRFGHLVGDALLCKVARVIETTVRQMNGESFVSRYGGEEFAVLLSHTILAGAGEVADRIRSQMAAMRWQYHIQGSDAVIVATVSIGVAQFRVGDTSASLVARADKALYRAKSEGRNRVGLERP